MDAIRGYCGRERLADFYLLAALLGRDAAQIQGDEQFLDFLGIDLWVVPSIAVFEIWRGYGFYVLVFLAGLMAIPRDVYEAAYVDGAGGFKAFLYITLPLLRPTVLLVTVLAVIFNFQLFDAVLMLTSGGPANRSMSVVYYIYRSVFAFANLGHAATMSVLLFLIVMALTLVQLRIGRERE